ncbi:hypothetical protein [Colwellia polaris]|uniref:hypothetical protein n=1 Tax=Colwellia polaris TaxID=326537 RepID=UPI000A16DDC4|nr:hypothetical protein [Colwellia polaris]
MIKLEQKQMIIKKVKEWAGGEEQALHWYKNEIIPAMHLTPEQAIEQGHYDTLMDYLESISLGGYA